MISLGLAPMLRPGGERIAEVVMPAIRETLEDMFPVRVESLPPHAPPAEALDAARGQTSAPVILHPVLAAHACDSSKVLEVTEDDLFIPMLSFVFGQAQLDGRAGVISLARLKAEYYGFGPDEALLVRRARIVALHETGHLLGLVHCQMPDCAMRPASNIHQSDLKRAALCPGCASVFLETQR
jgi:archaemetzincin